MNDHRCLPLITYERRVALMESLGEGCPLLVGVGSDPKILTCAFEPYRDVERARRFPLCSRSERAGRPAPQPQKVQDPRMLSACYFWGRASLTKQWRHGALATGSKARTCRTKTAQTLRPAVPGERKTGTLNAAAGAYHAFDQGFPTILEPKPSPKQRGASQPKLGKAKLFPSNGVKALARTSVLNSRFAREISFSALSPLPECTWRAASTCLTDPTRRL